MASSPSGSASSTPKERGQFGLAEPAVPPATEGEQRLLEIWQEVLDIRGLGVEDDYFELGGDSLVGLILFGEVESSFGQALPVSVLLDCPTVRLLAARLDEGAAPTAPAPAAEVSAPAAATPVPAVAIRREAVQRP